MTRNLSRRLALSLGPAALLPWRSWGADAPLPAGADKNIQGISDEALRMTVEVKLNGQGPFRFVVDTGADRSVISDQVAAALKLAPNPDVIVQGIARAVTAPTVAVDTLEIGSMMVKNMVIPVLPQSWLGIDGFLGLDAIDNRRVVFDFKNQRLRINRSTSAPITEFWLSDFYTPNDLVVRADGSNGRLRAVDCSVDRVRAAAFIDSGSQATIGNSSLAAALQDRGARFDEKSSIELSGITGGSVIGKLMSMHVIRFGGVDFTQHSLIIADMPVFNVWGLADRPALFIGMDFLKLTSAVTIDFGEHEYHFKFSDLRVARA